MEFELVNNTKGATYDIIHKIVNPDGLAKCLTDDVWRRHEWNPKRSLFFNLVGNALTRVLHGLVTGYTCTYTLRIRIRNLNEYIFAYESCKQMQVYCYRERRVFLNFVIFIIFMEIRILNYSEKYFFNVKSCQKLCKPLSL
jgi:hypothetical protein